jgi:P-type Ca2+ transporter type 2C
MDWHLLSYQEVAGALKSDSGGLNEADATQRLEKYGKNEIEDKKKKTLPQLILHQFTDLMILILIAAAVISGFLGDLTDTIVILAIIFLNALVGFIQEYKAEKAMEALKSMSAGEALVIREGKKFKIAAALLVPGDVVVLEAGNIIPADLRFFETNYLKVDESALTGESEHVEKTTDALNSGNYAPGDMLNMGFKNTSVTYGRALAYVIGTGMNTSIGRIAGLIQTEDRMSPLRKRLSGFTKKLSLAILIVCILFFGIGLLRGQSPLYMLLITISVAVAAIPEALPALVTIALAFGAKRLVKSKALVRNLPAVESLGSVTYICTDKTGTLTLNKMVVREIFENEPDQLKHVFKDNKPLFHAMALNNDVIKDKAGKSIGESTELALTCYASENGFEKEALEIKYPRVAELPFDSVRKLMTTVHRYERGFIVITKGAVEVLLELLDQTQSEEKERFELKANEMAGSGYRVLGYAVKIIEGLPPESEHSQLETSLSFLGFAGLMDPPREEAKSAVELCRKAGIIPVMITGDHKLTATSIAKELNIISSESDMVIDGVELAAMDVAEFESKVENIRVYARVSPEQKLKIITGLQDKGHFVAMTGDGVNDAPALKNADIGVAMGINGTDVAKEASDMILLDDNFATIVEAVAHGRRIFDNILKFIKYILAGNSGELWALILAPFFGLPIPLLPIQILWVNLVSDGLPGLALASEPAEPDIMNRPPFSPGRSIFSGGMSIHILWVGFLIGITTIGTQAWAINNNIEYWQTMAFTVLCFSQMAQVTSIRRNQSIFKAQFFSNKAMLLALLSTLLLQLMIIYTPFFNTVFKTQPLSLKDLTITFAASAIIFIALEIEKILKRFWLTNQSK